MLRVELGEPRPGLAVLSELKLRAGQGPAAGADLAAVLLKLRLVLQRIHLRHRPFHEQEDDPLGLTRKCGGFGASGPGPAARLPVAAAALPVVLGRACRRARGRPNPAAGALQSLASGDQEFVDIQGSKGLDIARSSLLRLPSPDVAELGRAKQGLTKAGPCGRLRIHRLGRWLFVGWFGASAAHRFSVGESHSGSLCESPASDSWIGSLCSSGPFRRPLTTREVPSDSFAAARTPQDNHRLARSRQVGRRGPGSAGTPGRSAGVARRPRLQ